MITKRTAESGDGKSSGKKPLLSSAGLSAMLLLAAFLAIPCGAFGAVAPPSGNGKVTLAWDPSPTASVVGYRIYYGTGSGNYAASVSFGKVTTGIVSNLLSGITYYFTATAYTASGLESDPSNEINYTVPGGATPIQQIALVNGQAVMTLAGLNGRKYQIQTSTNLISWSTLNTVTIGLSGITNLIDSGASRNSKRFYRAIEVSP